MQLSELGERICILGRSNSGKSTLAVAIAQERSLEAIHLDQLYHRPHTDWEPRPRDEFVALHDTVITRDRWVMEGNYSLCLPQRLARATGVIVLDVSTVTSIFRYFRRTLVRRPRFGALEGSRDSLKWEMIHYILVTAPRRRQPMAAMYAQIMVPKIRLGSVREIRECCDAWGLS